MLTSSLLTDRVFLHTPLLETLGREADVSIWATSAAGASEVWGAAPAAVEGFPAVSPFREFPYNYMRRLNDFVWDYRQRTSSRTSAWRHFRRGDVRLPVRALRPPAYVLAALRAERALEASIERLLLGYERSREATLRLRALRPAAVVVTGPFQFEQPAVVAAARRLGVPILALIPSWDNLSTKNRLVFKYDGYMVWSEWSRDELRRLYPAAGDVPVYVVGAPQFDVFFQKRFESSRAEFCATQRLRADLPVILYAVGSPNFLPGEVHGALYMAERVSEGHFGDVQLIVRPHPLHDDGRLAAMFARYGPRVVVQHTADEDPLLSTRTQGLEKTSEWVNTFRHADVVVNLSSTVAVDAALFDRPVVNLDFDPTPGRPHQRLVRDINHLWTHYKPVAESGGVWLVDSYDEMLRAVRTYLDRPELHRDRRRWVAEHVCQYVDGRCGERMGLAILDFVRSKEGSRA